jgi:hypothetical protein
MRILSVKPSPLWNSYHLKKNHNNNFAEWTNGNFVFSILVTEEGGDILKILDADWLFGIETTFFVGMYLQMHVCVGFELTWIRNAFAVFLSLLSCSFLQRDQGSRISDDIWCEVQWWKQNRFLSSEMIYVSLLLLKILTSEEKFLMQGSEFVDERTAWSLDQNTSLRGEQIGY